MNRKGSKYYIGQLLYAKRTKDGLHANQRYIVVNLYKVKKDTHVDVQYSYNGQNIILRKKSVKRFRNKQR